jgi:hypothetical protein
VDDVLLIGLSMKDIHNTEALLCKECEMSDMGPCSYYLGMHLHWDRHRRTLLLEQSQYIQHVLNTFDMGKCKPA